MGDKYVDEYVCGLLVMFLSEHWRVFEQFCSERGKMPKRFINL